MMAVMAGIVGGTIGFRMLFVNEGYRQIINKMREEQENDDLVSVNQYPTIANMIHRQKDNQQEIILDGLIMIWIIVVGFTAALGLFSSLHVPILTSATMFIISVSTFQSHVRKIIQNLT